MNDTTDRDAIKKARESFTGQNLTESQADIVAGLIHFVKSEKRSIRNTLPAAAPWGTAA